MATPVGIKSVNTTSPAAKPAFDLAAALKSAGPMSTKADLATALKGLNGGALADAILSKQPGTEKVGGDFLQALIENLKSDKGASKSKVSHERLDGLNKLATSLKPSTTTPAVTKDAVGDTLKPTKTAEQKAVDAERTSDGQKALAKSAKGLGFETTEKAAATEAPTSVGADGINTMLNETRGALDQLDATLLGLPQDIKQQTADAMNGFGRMPNSARPVVAQVEGQLSALNDKISKLSVDDQRSFYQELGINYDVAQAGGDNPGAAKLPNGSPTPTPLARTNLDAMNPKADPTIGSRIDPLQNPALLPINNGQQPMQAASNRGKPPIGQLKDILVNRLRFAGIQPTQMPPINWDNPTEDVGMSMMRPQQPRQVTLPALQPMPGGLEKLANTFGPSIGADQMTAFIAEAKKQGVKPETIADQIIAKQGPFAQLTPRLGEGLNTLMSSLDQSDKSKKGVAAFQQRANGLVAIASAAAASTDGVKTSGGNLISGDDMKALLSQGGGSAQQIAQDLLAKRGPLQGRMTQDSMNALISALPPDGLKTKAEGAAYMQMMDGLKGMMAGLPAGVGSVVAGAAYGMQGNVPYPLNNNIESNIATMGAGFMPTGNHGLDLANAIAAAPAYSPTEQALLAQIQDPQQRAMQALQMHMQKQALLATMLSNLANMRHEMLKTVANNLRG